MSIASIDFLFVLNKSEHRKFSIYMQWSNYHNKSLNIFFNRTKSDIILHGALVNTDSHQAIRYEHYTQTRLFVFSQNRWQRCSSVELNVSSEKSLSLNQWQRKTTYNTSDCFTLDFYIIFVSIWIKRKQLFIKYGAREYYDMVNISN